MPVQYGLVGLILVQVTHLEPSHFGVDSLHGVQTEPVQYGLSLFRTAQLLQTLLALCVCGHEETHFVPSQYMPPSVGRHFLQILSMLTTGAASVQFGIHFMLSSLMCPRHSQAFPSAVGV